MKRRSVDYDGPDLVLQRPSMEITRPKDRISFQSPCNFLTRRKKAERPPEGGLSISARQAE
jgi:hypothetical protein